LKYFKSLNIGDEVDLLVYKVNNTKYLVEGTIAGLYVSFKAHDTIKSLKRSNDSTEAVIKEITPAGYNVELHYDTIILPGSSCQTLLRVLTNFQTQKV
jgi:ribosomal protein S1